MEIMVQIKKSLNIYKLSYEKMNAKYEEIKSLRDETFKHLKAKTKDHEDLMFRTSELKNIASDFYKLTNDLGADTRSDFEYFESQIRLGYADNHLKNLGFLKITETSRKDAVSSFIEMKELSNVLGRIKSLSLGYQNLFESLKMDEVDFRMGAKHNMQAKGMF
jgi:hypothetical protein